MGSPIAENTVLLGGLVVQIMTLCYLIKYVRATVGIQEAAAAQTQASQDLVRVGGEQIRVSQQLVNAANEQSEGLSRPVIFPRSIERQGDFLLIRLLNIGAGPAIEIRGFILDNPGSAQECRFEFQWSLPYLEAHQDTATRVMGVAPSQHKRKVKCSYRSISGLKYVSATEFDDRNTVCDFVVERVDTSAT